VIENQQHTEYDPVPKRDRHSLVGMAGPLRRSYKKNNIGVTVLFLNKAVTIELFMVAHTN
jgi:hypothetical protein